MREIQEEQKAREAQRAYINRLAKQRAARPAATTNHTIRESYRPVHTAPTSRKAHPITFTEERGETIRSCVARGEDPVEVLGWDEYQRQTRALEKQYPKEPTLDWNERRGYE